MFKLCYRAFLDPVGDGMIMKHLADDLFNRFLFHAEVVHFAVGKNVPASLRHFVSRNLQLN